MPTIQIHSIQSFGLAFLIYLSSKSFCLSKVYFCLNLLPTVLFQPSRFFPPIIVSSAFFCSSHRSLEFTRPGLLWSSGILLRLFSFWYLTTYSHSFLLTFLWFFMKFGLHLRPIHFPLLLFLSQDFFTSLLIPKASLPWAALSNLFHIFLTFFYNCRLNLGLFLQKWASSLNADP